MDRNPNSLVRNSRIYEPAEGYDLAAEAYENWHWFEFWKKNEVPLVRKWAAAQAPGSILDVGSGSGLYRPIFEQLGYSVIGVDLSLGMLRLQEMKNPGAALILASATSLPLQSNSMDYLLCTRVLSHVEHVRRAFSEFARVTKPGAQLFISDVHPEHRYSEMSIPTARETISIQTYKHPMREIHEAIDSNGLEVIQCEQFFVNDLAWKPPLEKFGNIYDEPARPVFYACILRRP